MSLKIFCKAQSTIAYVAMATFLISAMIAVSFYFRRSLQGKYRESVDVFGEGVQYEPGMTSVE